MKTLYVLLLFLSFFSFCENQMTTGHYSLQPKHEPINSTTTSFTDPPTSSKTEISESEENDYLVYEITTPSLTKLYNIDDFKIDVDEKSIIITGKVGNKPNKYLYRSKLEKMDYHTLVLLEFPVKQGSMPIIGKEVLPGNMFKFTVKINKLSFEVPFEKASGNLKYREDGA